MRLHPARDNALSESGVVADLDSILAPNISFKLHGKIHEVAAITTMDFLKYINSLEKLDSLRLKESLTPMDLIDAYYDLCSSLVPSIKREDIENMTQAQIAAMLDLLREAVTGRMNEEKKKTIEMKAVK